MRPCANMHVYLYRDVVDMRKSITGLSVLVEQELGLDPFAPALFVFCSRRRDKIKVLYWERAGFVVWYKKLEKERFPWIRRREESLVSMTGQQLNWLLDGIDVFSMKPHETLLFESVL